MRRGRTYFGFQVILTGMELELRTGSVRARGSGRCRREKMGRNTVGTTNEMGQKTHELYVEGCAELSPCRLLRQHGDISLRRRCV